MFNEGEDADHDGELDDGGDDDVQDTIDVDADDDHDGESGDAEYIDGDEFDADGDSEVQGKPCRAELRHAQGAQMYNRHLVRSVEWRAQIACDWDFLSLLDLPMRRIARL